MMDFRGVIDQVPWHNIAGQQTDCRHVPDAIERLQSEDPEVRRSAYWRLDNHVIVQGGLYEGSFYVIPFLLQIALSDSPYGRVDALDLLVEIASGSASFDARVNFSTVEHPFRYYTPSENGVGMSLPIATRFAIACGLDDIMGLTVSEDEAEREMAHDLVLSFPEYAGPLSERLNQLANIHRANKPLAKKLYLLMNGLRHPR